MLGAACVEVGAQRDHDRRGRVHQLVEEAGPKRLVRQSVNTSSNWSTISNSGPGRASRDQVRGGRHHHDTPAARSAERRDEAGADERGLPASRRADDGHEATFEQPVEDGSHDLFSPEEEVIVLRSERDQPAVRARRRARRNRQTGRDERPPAGTSAKPISGGSSPLTLAAVALSTRTCPARSRSRAGPPRLPPR